MPLPGSIIVQKSKGNPPDGIINEIRTKYGISNPIDAGIVIPTASSTQASYGSIETVVLWNSFGWDTNKESAPYLQICFPNRYVFASSYSIRGINRIDYYQKAWSVHGFNANEESVESKWMKLAQHNANETNFCGGLNYCASTAVSSYSIKSLNKGFQCIRWTGIESSEPSSNFRFVASGVELYGALSTSSNNWKQKLRSQMCSLMNRFNPSVLFGLLFVAY